MLSLIGIGLSDPSDITLKGLALVKKSDKVYIENYTSKLQCTFTDLESLYGKNITPVEREFVENASILLQEAKEKNIVLLIIGDPFSATTHIDLLLQANALDILTNIVHNASILTAVGITGLQLYKFGKVTSIPFENKNVKTPIEVYKGNKKLGMHTLFLLDLRPEENEFLTIGEACKYLISKRISKETQAIGCARIGSESQIIKVGTLESLQILDFGHAPYCIIIPGPLHFMEEEALKEWR